MTLNEVQSTYINNKSKTFVNARANYNQFSVLAGIIARIGEDETHLLCLTTGVKCVPDVKLQNCQGLILHDSHAEILAIRSFNYLMLDLIQKCQEGQANNFIVQDQKTKLYKLKDDVKFEMYISELPCGDASLDSFIENDSTPWVQNNNSLNENDLLRGRSNYTQLGKVRTKPGRNDSPICLSKSCSDKLTLLAIKGLLNCLTQDLFQDQIYLDSIILPERTQSVIRCFNERLPIQFKNLMKCEITVSTTEIEFQSKLQELKLGLLKRPKNNEKANELGIVYIPVANILEAVNLGVKNGNGPKRVVKTQKGFSSICRKSLVDKRKNIGAMDCSTYFEWKSNQLEYQDFKINVKNAIGTWGRSTRDDFEI